MKQLYTGNLFWPTTRMPPKERPPLRNSIAAKVAIVGGGMSGITCAYALAMAGIDTVLLERGEVAGGSTSANTGMLQFCNDIMLSELIEQIGKEPAIKFYKRCLRAVDELEQAAGSLARDVDFRRRSSLYYASTEQELPKLQKEFRTLQEAGFAVEYWSPEEIAARFPFRKPGAIVTHGDAEVNPYKFVTGLSEAAVEAELRIFEHTDIVRHERSKGGGHRLHTSDGASVDSEYVVFAVGYEPEELRGKLVRADLNRSYSIATRPIAETSLQAWHNDWLIWETARPYLYMRTTVDNRIVAGGLDEDKEQPVQSESALKRKGQQLLDQVQALFPDMPLEMDHVWSATFGESQDNLPFIGEDPSMPGVFYNLGYGGNGTVYSMIGAQTILGMIQGTYKEHPLPFVGIRSANV